jgi:radical SAM protein with 4Fe4S-binding SPASM domain
MLFQKSALLKKKTNFRLPLDGKLDLTYRCNNNCRHCWLWLPSDSKEKHQELSFLEIRQIVDDARRLGTQAWYISGGEPMLRPDFFEICDYITQKSVFYTLNTNGTLITPEIARLLRRKGRKMVAIYGATEKVHDYITRTPGSFDAAMRGIHYLKAAGASFTVQIIPMRDNYHQYREMLKLAQSLSNDYRVGAAWLYLSANHSIPRNLEIVKQRLDPADVIALDPPSPSSVIYNESFGDHPINEKDDFLFSSCITDRQEFHIDPYGGMSFCPFVKDRKLRFNIRKGNFSQIWEESIPSLKNNIRGGKEYMENCGTCDFRNDCKWCPVYAYLEHGRYSAKIDYLCNTAKKNREFKKLWDIKHKRYYQIAGITIMVYSDIPITEKTFSATLKKFEIERPGEDKIYIRLVPSIPPFSELRLGREIYRQPPWAIYRQGESWVYLGIDSENDIENPRLVSIFNDDHSHGSVFSNVISPDVENLPSLTLFTSDQILLARVLADRQACYLHSSAIVINGQGLLFVGHSDAGKSTMMKMLREKGEILGDDRNIVRRWPDEFRVHGTWSHGELHDASPAQAPLRAIFFIEQAATNELALITDRQEKLGKILSHIIKALVTKDWWDKVLALAGQISKEIPAYRLKFDKSGKVIDVIKQFYEN